MTPPRLLLGFLAGFLSVLIFQSGLVAVLHAAGAVPSAPWSLAPVPPFGVPRSLSAAFWGGLWGVAYALLEPRLTARLGWWPGGDRKSTRLNSRHANISDAVFCLKKQNCLLFALVYP